MARDSGFRGLTFGRVRHSTSVRFRVWGLEVGCLGFREDPILQVYRFSACREYLVFSSALGLSGLGHREDPACQRFRV